MFGRRRLRNDRDTKFSFVGMMGQVSCMPTARTTCVDMMEVQYDNDEDYILVTFNGGGRTSFSDVTSSSTSRATTTRSGGCSAQYNFVVQQKKTFRVTSRRARSTDDRSSPTRCARTGAT